MATKNYMINDKWLDLDKQNIVELQSVDGVLDSLKVNGSEVVTPSGKITITENGTDIDIAQYATADVSVEGGGGSSDFTTAEVTISGATGEEATVLLMPNIQDSDRRTGVESAEVRASYTQKTYNVPLYKGHCLIKVNSGDVDGLTGNVTLDRGWLNVTGNCSLIGYYVQN